MQDLGRAERAAKEFLEALGLDLAASGMEKTPGRVAKMYAALFDGVGADTSAIWGETFTAESTGLVAVRHIPFSAMCEHHLVPFFGEADIVYQPRAGRIAGFSKFTTLVKTLSHRPQLQERLTWEIAEAVERDLGAEGVLVVVRARQLCMAMLEEASLGARTVTSERRGLFLDDEVQGREAWLMLGGSGRK